MLTRPGSLRTKNSKAQGTVRHPDKTLVVKATPHVVVADNSMVNYNGNYSGQDQFMNKRLNKTKSGEPSAKQRRIAAGGEAREVELKRKFLHGRPALLEKKKIQQQY